jgi:hypothetical protein
MSQPASYTKLLFSLSFSILLTTVALSTAAVVAYAQKPPAAFPTTLEKTGGHIVKITSPAKGQEVPTGGNLLVRGISGGNETTFPNCRVSVIVNGIKPYQNATATGNGGTNDFSTWSYKIPATYAVMKEGQNKITAKLSCKDNPVSARHNSVNVTGIANNKTAIITPISSKSIPAKHGFTQYPKTLSISFNLENPISSGRNQTIETTVHDGSNATIAGARVNGTVTNSANTLVSNFTGITNQSGKFSYSWKINNDYKTGPFAVVLYASANGYQHQIIPTTAVFNVNATSDHKSSSGGSDSSHHSSPSSHSSSSGNSHSSDSSSSGNSHSSDSSSSGNSHSSDSSSSGESGHTLSIIHIPHIHFPHIHPPKSPFS